MTQASVVALGGGHGLAASLRALRRITADLTAIVGVSDNGGSSGRLRAEFDVIPPGDLRMALTALCADDDDGRMWASALQHRFAGDGPLGGHAVGNLLISALWQQSGDIVAGLDAVSKLLGAQGRVLPLSLQPLDVVATVDFGDRIEQVRGQVAVAKTSGRVLEVGYEGPQATVTPEALSAIQQANVVVMGPGSWFTSVLNHLVLPEMATALTNCRAHKILVCNMTSPTGETDGFSPAEHLDVLLRQWPAIRFDCVIADSGLVENPQAAVDLRSAAARLGAHLLTEHLRDDVDPGIHDPGRLADAIGLYLESAHLNTEGR